MRIKVDVDGGECAIVVRDDTSVETYVRLGQIVEAPQLLALGVSWALENEEWKLRLMRKARQRLLKMIEESKGADEVSLVDTHTQ